MAEAIDCHPSTEEVYVCANNAASLRVEADRQGSADVLIAAGWSASRVGAAMLRLHSEWDAAEKPVRPTREQVAALAETMPLLVSSKPGRPGKLDLVRAAALANGWHLQELHALVGKLRMLPDVRREVAAQAVRWRIAEPLDVAAGAIKYWLDQHCTACDGRKWKLIAGTPALSNRVCHVCHGSGVGAVPHGQDGRRLCNYLDDCVSRAQQSIRSRLRKI